MRAEELPAALLERLDGEASGVSGQTFAQLLKRPEVPMEELAPVLRERLRGGDAVLRGWVAAMDAAGEAKLPAWVRNEMKTVETEIKYCGLSGSAAAVDGEDEAGGEEGDSGVVRLFGGEWAFERDEGDAFAGAAADAGAG